MAFLPSWGWRHSPKEVKGALQRVFVPGPAPLGRACCNLPIGKHISERRCKVFIRFSKMSLTSLSKAGTLSLFQTFLPTSIPTHLCRVLDSLMLSPPYSPRDLPFSDTMTLGSIFFQKRLWPPFPQVCPVPLECYMERTPSIWGLSGWSFTLMKWAATRKDLTYLQEALVIV